MMDQHQQHRQPSMYTVSSGPGRIVYDTPHLQMVPIRQNHHQLQHQHPLQHQQHQQPPPLHSPAYSTSSSQTPSLSSASPSSGALSPSEALNLGINLEQYISKRNERERSRVRNVNDAFDNLKNSLPLDSERQSKRISKVEILRTAIGYIKNLETLLEYKESPLVNVPAATSPSLKPITDSLSSSPKEQQASSPSHANSTDHATTTKEFTATQFLCKDHRQQRQQQQSYRESEQYRMIGPSQRALDHQELLANQPGATAESKQQHFYPVNWFADQSQDETLQVTMNADSNVQPENESFHCELEQSEGNSFHHQQHYHNQYGQHCFDQY